MVAAWNASSYTTQLANFGIASFEVLDDSFVSIAIAWDSKGQAQLLDFPNDNALTFSATLRNWQSFVNGDFSATEGVIKGRIKLKGSALSVLPYTGGFNFLAQVAKSVTK